MINYSVFKLRLHSGLLPKSTHSSLYTILNLFMLLLPLPDQSTFNLLLENLDSLISTVTVSKEHIYTPLPYQLHSTHPYLSVIRKMLRIVLREHKAMAMAMPMVCYHAWLPGAILADLTRLTLSDVGGRICLCQPRTFSTGMSHQDAGLKSAVSRQ